MPPNAANRYISWKGSNEKEETNFSPQKGTMKEEEAKVKEEASEATYRRWVVRVVFRDHARAHNPGPCFSAALTPNSFPV